MMSGFEAADLLSASPLWQALRQPADQRLVLVEPGFRAFTGGQVLERADALAQLLRGAGLRQGETIGLILPDGATGLIGFWAL